jgi:hypothetical protein
MKYLITAPDLIRNVNFRTLAEFDDALSISVPARRLLSETALRAGGANRAGTVSPSRQLAGEERGVPR